MATMESINAKANAGLATSIATAGVYAASNGLLNNLLGGNQPNHAQPVQPSAWNFAGTDVLAALALLSGYNRPSGCESDHVVTRYEAEQSNKISALESELARKNGEIYTDAKIADTYERLNIKIGELQNQICEQRVFNATSTALIGSIQGQIAQLMSLTKIVVPNSSVCPGWNTTTTA